MHDIVHAEQIFRYRPQRVESPHPHVRRQPCRGRTVGYVDVETVELGREGEGAGEVEEPDTVGKGGVGVRVWSFFLSFCVM